MYCWLGMCRHALPFCYQLWTNTFFQNKMYCTVMSKVSTYSSQYQKAAINTLKIHAYNSGNVRREALPRTIVWYSTTALCNPKERRQVWGRSRIRSMALCHPMGHSCWAHGEGSRMPTWAAMAMSVSCQSQGVRPQHRHVKHIVRRRWSDWVYFNLEMWPSLPFMMCQSKLPLAAVRILVLADSCKEQQTGRSQQQMW